LHYQVDLQIGGRPFAVALAVQGGARRLQVAHQDGLSSYDITNAAEPRLVSQHLLSLIGARRIHGDGLLGWDDHSAYELTSSGAKAIATLLSPTAGPDALVDQAGRSQPLTGFPATAHSRFGLLAWVGIDRVSIAVIAGTREG